jgi:ER membrane protein complex subunit 2
MAANDLLLQPPVHLSPATAVLLSQQAPRVLQNEPTSSKPFPFSLFTTPESSETWTKFENVLLACLRAGDDKSAHLCLEKLTERFGKSNERVMGLRGMYQEAVAETKEELDKLLEHYDKILEIDPVNMVFRRMPLSNHFDANMMLANCET